MVETAIKQISDTYSISQTDLSKRFNIPLRTIQDWYAGRRTPPDYVVGMITSLLEIDIRAE